MEMKYFRNLKECRVCKWWGIMCQMDQVQYMNELYQSHDTHCNLKIADNILFPITLIQSLLCEKRTLAVLMLRIPIYGPSTDPPATELHTT